MSNFRQILNLDPPPPRPLTAAQKLELAARMPLNTEFRMAWNAPKPTTLIQHLENISQFKGNR